MILSKQIAPYVVYEDDTIQHALQKINKNTRRQVYCVSESGILKGIVTDGDFRRWILSVEDIDLRQPVQLISNKKFVSAKATDNHRHIDHLLSRKITSVPVVDDAGHLTAIAWREEPTLRIGDTEIGETKPAFIIAEIGNNHNGSLDLAKKLIDEAAKSGADCAKFQLRDMESVYASAGAAKSEDLGTEYTLDLLRRFQLSVDEMFEALDYTHSRGMIPLCTAWDPNSLDRLDRYGLEGFKIASADLTNHSLIEAATQTGKPLLLSTGMSFEHEIQESVGLLKERGASFALLQCNSTYPTPMRDINLAYMDRLKDISHGPVGYSGHERGYEVCLAAIARGAKIIEKHFTLDRGMEGNDHRVSLLPQEFASMVRAIRNVEDAIGSGADRTMGQGERLNREVLAKSLVAARDIKKGERLAAEMIGIQSPGRGLQPSRMKDLVGVVACRDIAAGEIFFESDIKGESAKPRAYNFDRPWGIPVRYHDVAELTRGVPLDFVEIHFSYRDLDLTVSDYFKEPLDIGLVVHSPELFAGDHVMDLSSDDEEYRKRSIAELQRVIDRTRELTPFFTKTSRPAIIINAGGFTNDRFLAEDKRRVLYERVALALDELDEDGVEVIAQTMPPFPWHFGGQRYHNLFMDPAEIARFCAKHNRRICYDVSHSKLACNHFNWSLQNFTEQVGRYTAHLHIVDARGEHEEGLQIGDGEMDFQSLGEDLRKWAPNVSFIPEIWQGHKNGGEGFWIALDRLETFFAPKSARS